MADRYWVGGAGTWDATTTHWAASSGGTAGASVPTATDNVIFDTLSNFPTNASYAATIGTASTCLDISIAGPAANTVTITSGATAVINVYGSWLNAATGVAFSTAAGTINFLATSTGKTVTTNGVSLANTFLNFNGIGGYWTLGGAITITSGNSPNILAGTFDTGGFAMTLNNILSTTTTNARTINLNNSTISCSGSTAVSLAATNLTLNAGTSTITASGASVTFAGGGLTFYNVNFTSATAAINTVSITGANTFNDLNVTTTALQKIITLGANQTINGTLTLGATNTAPLRMSVVSDTVGTPRTLTVATLATLADVDFRDIVAAGTSSPWSGTRIGNCLGNSNITFAAGATKYWNLAAGGNWTSTAWALTSGGGAVAVNNFPLAQDTVVIEQTGLNNGATITMNTNADIGTLDMSTRTTNTLTLALGNTDPKFYGNVTFFTNLTTTGSSSPTYQFQGQGLANTLNTAGVTLALSQFNVNCPTGSLTLLSNATIELTASTSGTAILTAGTFNLNGFNLTAVAFSSSNSNTRTITQGSGTITITGTSGTVWNTGTSTNLTYTTTPTVNANYSGAVGSRTINTDATIPINLNVTAGTDTITNVAGSSFNNLNFTGFAGTLANVGRFIYGNLTLSTGMTLTAGTLITQFSGVGTATITSNTQTFTNLILYSEQFDNAVWTKGVGLVVTADTTVAPDSTTTGDTVTADSSISIYQGVTSVIGIAYTQSVYIKAGGGNPATSLLFRDDTGAGRNITVDPATGVVTSPSGTLISSGSTSVGNGWYRIYMSYLADTTTVRGLIRPISAGLAQTFFVWGAQTEIGATLTTYIPTTATTASITGDRIIDFPVTFNGTGTTNCLDALTLGSTRALTFTNGTLNLFAGVTSTVGSFVTTGTTAKYLGSTTPGTQATISDASGTDTVSYLTIKDSNATGGATWNALAITNVDAGNNTGWLFSTTPSVSNEVTMRLRSFTQPRRF